LAAGLAAVFTAGLATGASGVIGAVATEDAGLTGLLDIETFQILNGMYSLYGFAQPKRKAHKTCGPFEKRLCATPYCVRSGNAF
jgi:hypothetical protein